MAKKKQMDAQTILKYSIWGVLPVAVLVAIGVTFSAMSSITANFNSTKQALESAKQTVDGIAGDANHPNQKTIDAIEVDTDTLRDVVLAAWKYLETDQRDRNRWPAILGADFIDIVENLKPGEEIPTRYCERYHAFVRDYLPDLLLFVDYRRVQHRRIDFRTGRPMLDTDGNEIWDEDDDATKALLEAGRASAGAGSIIGSGGGMDGGSSAFSGMSMGSDMSGSSSTLGTSVVDENTRVYGKVDWNTPEIATLVTWLDRPNTAQIRVGQEDLWVYRALLSVIKETNVRASSLANAPIKRIDNLLIGKEAGMAMRAIANPIGNLGSGGGVSVEGMSSDSAGSAEGGTSTGPSLTASDAEWRRFLLDGRYVDLELAPLSADAELPLPQCNRLPVCLRLTVDQRRIPDILVNCANCDMPIDVLNIRVNPGAAKTFDLAAFASTGGGMSESGDSDSGGGGGGSGMGTAGSGDSGSVAIGGSVSEYGTEVMMVEIYGIINIFNLSQHAGIAKEKPKPQVTFDMEESPLPVEPDPLDDTNMDSTEE